MSEFLSVAKENLTFVLVCVLVIVALFVLARLFERAFKNSINKVSKSKYVAYVAMFSALAGVLMFLEIPLFFAPSFYKIDLSEIPVLICTFYLGPVAGVAAELFKVVIKLMLKGTSSAFVGDFANFCIGCSMILPATLVYHVHKTKKNAVLGLVLGIAVMTVFGSLLNAVYLLPKFAQLYGMPLDAIVALGTAVNAKITSVSTLVLYAVVPFNLLKGAIVSVLTFLLYKRVENIIFKVKTEKVPPAEKAVSSQPSPVGNNSAQDSESH